MALIKIFLQEEKNVLRDMIQKKKSYCNNLREMWEAFEIKNISFITLYIFNRPDCVCHIEMQSEAVRQCDFI